MYMEGSSLDSKRMIVMKESAGRLSADAGKDSMSQTITKSFDPETGNEMARVEEDGIVLVCHHPREGIWCCCADDGHAQCCCGHDLNSAINAWFKNEESGE